MSAMARHLPTLLLILNISRSATATPASLIFARENTCAAQNLEKCPSSLPDNFCCSSGNTCLPLAGNTSALCCPDGQDCEFIQRITCDLGEQDADKHPGAPIKTTVTDVKLETCQDGCCPFGYSCSSDGLCGKNKDQSKSPEEDKSPDTSATSTSSAPSSTSSPASTSTDSPGSTSSSTSTAAPAKDGSGSGSDSSPETTSIVGGVVGGCLVLLLIAVIIFLYIRRSNRRHLANLEKNSHAGPSSVAVGNVISEPIIQPNSYRSDFMLKTPSVHSSIHGVPTIVETTTPSIRGATPAPGGPPYPRASIPNPFNSPDPSARSPATSRFSHASSSGDGPYSYDEYGDYGGDDEDSDRNAANTSSPSQIRTGKVSSSTRLAPIRAMKASSQHLRRLTPSSAGGWGKNKREPSSENINVFADPNTVGKTSGEGFGGGDRGHNRTTTFSDLMDEAELGDMRRGKPYVPGTTPRI